MAVIEKFVKTGEAWAKVTSVLPPGDLDTGGLYGSWPDSFAWGEDGTLVSGYVANDELFIHLDGDSPNNPSQTLNNPAQNGRCGVALDMGNNFIVTQGTEGDAQVWSRPNASSPWAYTEQVGSTYFENNGVFVSPDDKTVILSHASEQGPIEAFSGDVAGAFDDPQLIAPVVDDPVSPLAKWKFMGAGDYQLIVGTVYRDPSLANNVYKFSDGIAFIYAGTPPAPDTMFWWKSLIYATQTTGPAPDPQPSLDLPTPPSLPPWSDLGTTRGSLIGLNITEPGLVPSLANVSGTYLNVMYTNGKGVGGLMICSFNSTGELVTCVFVEDNEFYEFQYQVGDVIVPSVWLDGFNNWQDIQTYPTVEVVSIQSSQLPITADFQPYELSIVTDGILEGAAVDGTYDIPTLPATGQLGTGGKLQKTVLNGQFTSPGYVIDGLATFDQGYITGELYLLDIIGTIPGVTGVNNQYVQVSGMILFEDEEEGGG